MLVDSQSGRTNETSAAGWGEGGWWCESQWGKCEEKRDFFCFQKRRRAKKLGGVEVGALRASVVKG